MITSRYLMIGTRRYRDHAGRTVRMAYSARQASTLTLEETVAEALATGALDRLTPQQRDLLVQREAVVPDGEDELATVLGRLRRSSANPGLRRFSLMPTSYCNMACDYCGQEHRKGVLDRARMERVAARVEAAIADPATRTVRVTWFGGEPLLALRVIRELSARFVAAADKHSTAYSSRMPSNGSLLNLRTMRILHDECRLRELSVTLDGPQPVHDRRRVRRAGVGSFHRTVSVLAEAVKRGLVPDMTIEIRVNVDQENIDTVPDLLTDLACFGLASPQVRLNLAPVHSWGNDVSAVELPARRYAELEAGWLALARSLGITVPEMPGALKPTTCHATTVHGEIVDSDGRIYTCSEHPLVPGVRDTGVVARIEDLAGGAPRPPGAFDDWYDQVADGQQQCGRCPVLPVCGGSCPKLWREGYLPCPSIRFNWETRLDLTAQRLGYRPVEEEVPA